MKLNKKEKQIIVEFLYAMGKDTLIKSEGQDVIDLFKKKKVKGWENIKLETFSIFMAIKMQIDVLERQQMMKDYLSGNL